MFRAGFNHEQAVRAVGIFRLIPLRFFIADKALLVVPVGRVRRAVFIKFIVPDHFPFLRAPAGGGRQQHG